MTSIRTMVNVVGRHDMVVHQLEGRGGEGRGGERRGGERRGGEG